MLCAGQLCQGMETTLFSCLLDQFCSFQHDGAHLSKTKTYVSTRRHVETGTQMESREETRSSLCVTG